MVRKVSTLICLIFVLNINANEVSIQNVTVTKQSKGVYSFDVTLLHNDTSWKHYANKWQVTNKNGKVYATRVLFHPHINEQPFTRSKSNIKIPSHIKEVYIKAHDLVHKYSKQKYKVVLP